MSLAPFLVLPVVSGFVFCTIWKLTRYRIARQDGHKLYFGAVWYGFFIFIFSAQIHMILFVYIDSYRAVLVLLSNGIWKVTQEEIFGRASIAAILASTVVWGPLLAHILNLPIYSERWYWLPRRVTTLSGNLHRIILNDVLKHNHIEQLFIRSMELSLPVMVTLQSGKVYVGFPLDNVDPIEKRKSFMLLPLLSGYRNEKHEVEFTTGYEEVIEQSKKESSNSGAQNIFAIVIEADQICTSRLFDLKVYSQHFNPPQKSGVVDNQQGPG